MTELTAQKDTGQVTTQLSKNLSNLDDLERVVAELQERLADVLNPNVPPTEAGKAEKETLVSLAEQISLSSFRICKASATLRCIVNRLEI